MLKEVYNLWTGIKLSVTQECVFSVKKRSCILGYFNNNA